MLYEWNETASLEAFVVEISIFTLLELVLKLLALR